MKALYVRPSQALLPDVRLVADSAIGRDTMPLFIPDIFPGWEAEVCLAFRVNRLGKNIPEKFALRYIDAVGAVAVLRHREMEQNGPCGAWGVMDSTVTTGRWSEFAGETHTLCVNGSASQHTTAGIALARCISEVSRLATIKSGDIFIMADTAVTASLVPDTYIEADVNGSEALRLKVK